MSKRARKMAERIRKFLADPCNERIRRAPHAGEIVDGHLVMHNGLSVKPMDACYMKLLQANAGCHEPQEELVFQEVLRHIPDGGSIVELGAYWGFYSMWFAKAVAGARCFLVEPDAEHLEVGRYNFAHNSLDGKFFSARIGTRELTLPKFAEQQNIEFIDVLHADIQGAEYQMLQDAEPLLRDGKIGYVFVGTHSQDLHYRCLQFLEQCGYCTIANADFANGTYCEDGVLVARLGSLVGVEPMEVPRRTPHEPFTLPAKPPVEIKRVLKSALRTLFPV